MTEELIVKHCSPTLAGMKAGNMFTCPYECYQQVKEDIRQINRRLRAKGLRMIPLRFSEKRVLLYLYRISKLNSDLSNKHARELLSKEGYLEDHCNTCIVKLVEKFRKCEGIPHEVGLFLGYPPEDVQGFIENRACDYKCSGCWKVYGNKEEALKTFQKYKICTEIYCAQWKSGAPLEALAVAG